MNQADVNQYFGTNWKPDYDKFLYSGWALLNKINSKETVIDVGCGYNLFKTHFGDRLYGIDPAVIEGVDEVVSIEEFKTDKQWDVALCLGSLNFGDASIVYPQVEKVVSLVKPGGRIFWRQNPGLGDHPWKGVEAVQFFPWTIELNYELAEKYNCKVVDCRWDLGQRIYAEWKVQ